MEAKERAWHLGKPKTNCTCIRNLKDGYAGGGKRKRRKDFQVDDVKKHNIHVKLTSFKLGLFGKLVV